MLSKIMRPKLKNAFLKCQHGSAFIFRLTNLFWCFQKDKLKTPGSRNGLLERMSKMRSLFWTKSEMYQRMNVAERIGKRRLKWFAGDD